MNGTLSKCFIVAAREIDNFFCCKLLLSAQRSLLVIRVSERNKLHECATSFFSKRQRITLRLLYAIGRPSVVCLSVVCNVGAPYSGG